MVSKAITVFGSSHGRPGDAGYEQARELGRLLAGAGFDVVSGGYDGSMQGVSQGAVEGGGKAVGVTCATFGSNPKGLNGNAYLSESVHAPDLPARLRQLVELADGFVVLAGGIGTLAELFLVWNLIAVQAIDKPCVLLGEHWRRVLAALVQETRVEAAHMAMLHVVDTPAAAVQILIACSQ